MGSQNHRVIAAKVVTQVPSSVTIDWRMRESARAGITVAVKRILNKFGYPLNLQDAAVQAVLMPGQLPMQRLDHVNAKGIPVCGTISGRSSSHARGWVEFDTYICSWRRSCNVLY